MLKSPAGNLVPDDLVPYPHEWSILQECLTLKQFDQVKCHINELVDHTGGEFVTSQWQNTPWKETPFQLINDIVARRNGGSASRMFAIMVWIIFRDHDELFCFRGERREGSILLERQIYSRQETLN